MGIGAPEIVVIAVIAILLFGATRLPVFAKSLAESLRIFKKELKGSEERPAERPAELRGPELPPVLADSERLPAEPTQRTDSR